MSEEMGKLLQKQDLEEGDEQSEGSDEERSQDCNGRLKQLMWLLIDILASIPFWYVQFQSFPDWQFYTFLGVLLCAMMAWRLYRAYCMEKMPGSEDIPYTAACVHASDRELYLVATVHISPRAPKDVEAVINTTKPDITMIELDDERLDRMRDVPEEQMPKQPKPEDLQLISVTAAASNGPSSGPIKVRAQRALWNAEQAGNVITGDILFDEDDPYGLEDSSDGHDSHLALVMRGGPEGVWAPFAVKASTASKSGASALLVLNNDENLPLGRIGAGSLLGDLRIACNTCECGFPRIPVLLLPKDEGERILELVRTQQRPTAEITVMDDHYPRRTLRRRLCQDAALILSGIGVLYGIIQCFQVEVGAEFLAAELAAKANGIRCVCIDVDLNRFWSRLGWAVLPTPCNLFNSLVSWLAFPRLAFQFLFPPRSSVDVFGGMFLHGASFPCKTWISFILAGVCASFITSSILKLVGSGAELSAEETGVVKKEDREAAQAYIMLAIQMYLLPQVYDAVAASRDEAMYESMVKKCRQFASKRLVVVVGAGHANGILQRVRSSGL
mmetsp:Transcript_73513/g.129760  ORF Transcript_73513/g.129760 Transcript_73513/m.129760 type:complete len:558 (+) Transcript_73513:71-1744(+)